jgi:hypothetical protein
MNLATMIREDDGYLLLPGGLGLLEKKAASADNDNGRNPGCRRERRTTLAVS